MIDYEEAMARVATEQDKPDVVSIARSVREGNARVQVWPTGNGFITVINIGGQELSYVYTKPRDVGNLFKALYGGDLDSEMILKRLRRLLGYL